MTDQNLKKHLSRQQKTGFVLLLVFALLTIGLTFFQLRNTIYGPFVIRISKEELQARESMQFDESVRLQQIDTDQDGLSDYEELFFYETSPYLADTDSDGIDDKVEIDAGTNPLCPEGTACDVSEFGSGDAASFDFSLGTQVDTPAQILLNSSGGGAGTSTLSMSELISDPAVLREVLIATGKISAEDLEKISDEQLLLLAQQIAEQELAQASSPQNATSTQGQ